MENSIESVLSKHSNTDLRFLLQECDMIENIIINSSMAPTVIYKSDMLQELYNFKTLGIKKLIEQEIIRRVLIYAW